MECKVKPNLELEIYKEGEAYVISPNGKVFYIRNTAQLTDLRLQIAKTQEKGWKMKVGDKYFSLDDRMPIKGLNDNSYNLTVELCMYRRYQDSKSVLPYEVWLENEKKAIIS
jgi:hypothetical protein